MDRSAPVMSVSIVPPGEGKQRIDVSEIVLALTFDDDEKKAHKVDLDLSNWDLSLFDDTNWRKGNKIIVSWGYAGNMSEPEECVIQSVKGGTVLKIEALAKGILMNKKHVARLFERVKYSDIARTIAEESGYGSEVQDIEDTEVVHDHVSQARMTNAEFLRHLAQREGFEFFIDGTGFHFHRRKMNQKVTRTFVYYIDPGQGDMWNLAVENDVTAAPAKVTAKGRDPLKKEEINTESNNTTTKRDGTAPVLEQITDFGETTLKEQAVESTVLTASGNAASAKREADGRFIQATQTVAKISFDAIGDPRVRAKQVIAVQNISKRLSGKYYITTCSHKLTATEYTMTVKCRSDGGHSKTGGGGGEKSKGNPNNQPEKDPNALTPHEDINEFGETTVRYRRDK